MLLATSSASAAASWSTPRRTGCWTRAGRRWPGRSCPACSAGSTSRCGSCPGPPSCSLIAATPFPSLIQIPLDVLVERGPPGRAARVAGRAGGLGGGHPRPVPLGAAARRAEAGGAGWLARGSRRTAHLLRAQMRSQAQYRASFAIDVAGNVAFGVLDVVTRAGAVPREPDARRLHVRRGGPDVRARRARRSRWPTSPSATSSGCGSTCARACSTPCWCARSAR